MSRNTVIGLASLPGAGKGELAEQLALLGVEHMHVGSVVRATAESNGFVPVEETREAYLPFWQQYSQDHGQDWLARIAIRSAEENKRPVLMDGVRIPADVETIALQGVMLWLHADLPNLANRIISRQRVEDQKTLTVDAYIDVMQKDLANKGNFSMGEIRGLCTTALLPVPTITDSSDRADHYHDLAEHILELHKAVR